MDDRDSHFEGSVPLLYDKYLVPLVFEPYARDLAARVKRIAPEKILEIACGTGVVTRELASSVNDATIVASDLNQPMLDRAASTGIGRSVVWQKADALNLPFEDDSFDVVVCQFGAMFFPDKPKAFNEARRVLRKRGAYIFSVWDRIEDNEFADVITQAMVPLFPADPPRFLARTPHGYHDVATIRDDMEKGGFRNAQIETVAKRSRANSPRDPAVAYCQGTPLRDELFARDSGRIAEATDVAENAIARDYGAGPVDAGIQAHVIVANKE